MTKLPIALQLYTVRDLIAKDFVGTLKEVANIGYKYVEMAGYGDLKGPKEAKKVLDDLGIKPCGSHAMLEGMETDLGKLLDENDVIGNKNIVIPWMMEDRRKDAAAWKKLGQEISKVAAEAKKRGFAIGYHNHDFEFQKFDGQVGLDILFANADPLVKSELDVYWVKKGGQDPVAYINKLGSRVFLLHLKDMASGSEQKFAPVGTGILDFKAIVAAGLKAGTQYGIVEQDNTYEVPPLKAVRTSFENLTKMGII